MKRPLWMMGLCIALSRLAFAQSTTILPNASEFNNDSVDESAYTIKATMSNPKPGKFSATIRALNYSSTSDGIGIWATHFGYGTAIRAGSDKGLGILASSIDGIGIYAESQTQSAANFVASIAANNSDVVIIGNKGLGAGLTVNLTNATSAANAINVFHSGTGNGINVETNAISIKALSTGLHGAAVLGENNLGAAIMGRNASAGITAAVSGRNESSGIGVKGLSTGTGIGVLGQAGVENSTGIAGKFENENASNSSNALEVITNGTGAAASIKNTNSGGKGSALIVGKSKPYIDGFTTAAHVDLEVRHSIEGYIGMSGLRILNTAPNLSNWTLYAGNMTGNLFLYANGANKGVFNAATGAYTTVSDKRLKTNVKDYTATLTDVMKMKVKSYQRFDSNKTEIGLMAQDALKYFPEIVYDNTNDKGEQFYTMDYSRIGVVAIKAIQEQQSIIIKQQQMLQQHEEAIETLKKELNELKKSQGK